MPTVLLPSKPNAPLAYELVEGDGKSNIFVVFLNGLGRPQSFWKPTIDLFEQADVPIKPRILTYDRYGQGASARDPRQDDPEREPGYAHTLDDVVDDLSGLIQVLSDGKHEKLVFVANSIGAHIARRYADFHPGEVQGIMFLDSNPGNVELPAGVWPHPDDPTFKVPSFTTLEEYTAIYNKLCAIFGSDVKNPEGFDRRNIKSILPHPDLPKLNASLSNNDGPWITVVGHDVDTISKQELRDLKIPIGLSALYTQPMWQKYNEGLCQLTTPGRARGVIIAPESGHFIQVDNPAFVAKELSELLKRVEGLE